MNYALLYQTITIPRVITPILPRFHHCSRRDVFQLQIQNYQTKKPILYRTMTNKTLE